MINKKLLTGICSLTLATSLALPSATFAQVSDESASTNSEYVSNEVGNMSVTSANIEEEDNLPTNFRNVKISDKNYYSKTIKLGNAKASISVVYPVLEIENNEAATTRINKNIKRLFVTNTVNDVKNDESNKNLKKKDSMSIVIEPSDAVYDYECFRLGDIICVGYQKTTSVKSLAYPITENKVFYFNANTGKQVSAASLFNLNKLYKAAATEIVSYIDMERSFTYGDDDYFSKDVLTVASLVDAFKQGKACFYLDPTGATVVIDEDIVGPHAMGVKTYFVSMDKITKSIKKNAKTTLFPLNEYLYSLKFSAGTGYYWTYEITDGDGVITVIEQLSYASPNVPGLSGGKCVAPFLIIGNENGEANIHFSLVRSWEPESPAKEIDVYVCITSGIIEIE